MAIETILAETGVVTEEERRIRIEDLRENQTPSLPRPQGAGRAMARVFGEMIHTGG